MPIEGGILGLLLNKSGDVVVLLGGIGLFTEKIFAGVRLLRCSEINCCGCYVKREVITDNLVETPDSNVTETSDEIVVT